MKPDWKDAPEWANWLAMDDDGQWFWYELEPAKLEGYWVPNYAGKFGRASPDWRESLEQRP